MPFAKPSSKRVPKTVREYALYCTMQNALRVHRRFKAGGPGLVVLKTPDGYSANDYVNGVIAQLYPHDDYRRSDAGFICISAGSTSRKSAEAFREDCQDKFRAIVIVEDGATVPAEVILAADFIVDVPPISARHLRAACWVVLKVRVSEAEAAAILKFPLQYVWPVLRRGRSAKDVLRRLSELPEEQRPTEEKRSAQEVPPLSQMYGYGQAKDWGISLSKDLADWQQGKITWDDIDRGIVLSGPPGVGKSIFAKAVAKECNVPLIATSLGRWQARGHLGDLLKSMRSDFASAKEAAPSILFIDEIDSIGDREKFAHDNKDYSIQVVNAFLECLDGLDSREGVVVIGATNNIQRIDPAVLRAGRLDQHIEIPMPDALSRLAILHQHTDGQIPLLELEVLREATSGLTGADLAKVARDARRLARRQQRKLLLSDLSAALPEVFRIEGDFRRSIAIHEAGHTVVGNELGYGKFIGTRISRQIVLNGVNQQGGAAFFELPSMCRRDSDHFGTQIAVMLAGLAAEELVLGKTADGAGIGPHSDLATATRLATMMETRFGMGASLRHSLATSDEELEKLRISDRELAFRIDCRLSTQFAQAKEILSSKRELLDAVTEALFKNGSLTPDEYSMLSHRKHQQTRVDRPLSANRRPEHQHRSTRSTLPLGLDANRSPRSSAFPQD